MDLEPNQRKPNEVIGEEGESSISYRMLIRLIRFLSREGKEGLFPFKK